MGTVNELAPILVIAGPTASGKTSLAIQVAQILGGEIVNADSRQVYSLLDIGTAKPSDAERASVPHHLFDIRMPDERISAGEWARLAKATCVEILNRGNVPIVVGGSGLYIQALTDGFVAESVAIDSGIHSTLQLELQEHGSEAMFEQLRLFDPASAELYADKNPRRVLRALAWYRQFGTPISQAKEEEQQAGLHAVCFCLFPERQWLYDRINARTEQMFAAGFVEEVQAVLAKYNRHVQSLQTVGYREVIQFLQGECTLEEAKLLTAQKTRNYAKRQYTWFKKRQMEFVTESTEALATQIADKYISARDGAAIKTENKQQ